MNPLLLFGLLFLAASSQIILPPTVTSGPQIAIIFLQGAQIPADRYVPLLKAVQENSKKNKTKNSPLTPPPFPSLLNRNRFYM